MLPYVIIAGRGVPTYGICAVAGFLVSLLYVIFAGKRRKTERLWRDAADSFLIGALGAVVGGKLLYLLLMLPNLVRDLSEGRDMSWFVSHYLTSGMVFYGGLFGAILFSRLTARYLGTPISSLYSLLVPALSLTAGFGRIGCFFTGCCYGRETDCPVSVTFRYSLNAPNGVPLVPVQLYEAGFDFFLFFFLIWLGKKGHEEGLLSVYLGLYAVFRFVLEFFRGDAIRGHFLFLSTSQWISLGILFVLFLLKGRKKLHIMDSKNLKGK